MQNTAKTLTRYVLAHASAQFVCYAHAKLSNAHTLSASVQHAQIFSTAQKAQSYAQQHALNAKVQAVQCVRVQLTAHKHMLRVV